MYFDKFKSLDKVLTTSMFFQCDTSINAFSMRAILSHRWLYWHNMNMVAALEYGKVYGEHEKIHAERCLP